MFCWVMLLQPMQHDVPAEGTPGFAHAQYLSPVHLKPLAPSFMILPL
jgi:hypothetical protein